MVTVCCGDDGDLLQGKGSSLSGDEFQLQGEFVVELGQKKGSAEKFQEIMRWLHLYRVAVQSISLYILRIMEEMEILKHCWCF